MSDEVRSWPSVMAERKKHMGGKNLKEGNKVMEADWMVVANYRRGTNEFHSLFPDDQENNDARDGKSGILVEGWNRDHPVSKMLIQGLEVWVYLDTNRLCPLIPSLPQNVQ